MELVQRLLLEDEGVSFDEHGRIPLTRFQWRPSVPDPDCLEKSHAACRTPRSATMNPKIDGTEFGSITIDGEFYDHDVLIRLSGEIRKRKKKLSKAVYGTSHRISLDEAKFVYEEKAETIIIGAGQNGMAELSEEAIEYFKKKKCKVFQLPTPAAIGLWNKSHGPVIGLFHITC